MPVPQPPLLLPHCGGQVRMESHIWSILRHGDWPEDLGAVRAVTPGTACLHLHPDPILFSYLLAVLEPIAGPDGTVTGVPGLRLAELDDDHAALAMAGGHGRLVLHTRAEAVAMWQADETDRAKERLGDGDRGTLLRHRATLHPAEVPHLLQATDASDVLQCVSLRRDLAGRPARHHPQALHHLTRRPDMPPASVPVRGGRDIDPALLTPVTDPRPSAACLGDALARQLIQLLGQGRIRPGDVIADPIAAVTRLGGRDIAARCTQQVIQHVAHRYGLLRHRPLRPADPAPPRQSRGRIWAVHEMAAHTMGLIADELTRASASS
ncbi:hypothetical protein [Streptomyces clavuligerus]|uniref:hypothetical protein n=4 Tax=Streptomyces clavuligerus TaxID=1901 RepID=UPI0002D7448E|nr:hypothetical protein [Streptomyces clavuligerus]WDN56071.1 hypothetical protein LL058_29785 [Streptomyces clavuligerus]